MGERDSFLQAMICVSGIIVSIEMQSERLEYRQVRNTHLGVRTVEMGAGIMKKNEVLGLVCRARACGS